MKLGPKMPLQLLWLLRDGTGVLDSLRTLRIGSLASDGDRVVIAERFCNVPMPADLRVTCFLNSFSLRSMGGFKNRH